MNASSQIIKDANLINSTNIVPLLILQVVESSRSSQGILNLECDVWPPARSREATPEEATDRTLFLCDRRCVIIAFHKNVLPVPPYPERK
jgi:hypothetical protein